MLIVYQNFTLLNSSNLTWSVLAPDPRETLYPQEQLLLIFYCVLLLVTVLGNLLVCAAIFCDRRVRSPTNWFIVSLAVSDLFYACLSLPFRIKELVDNQDSSIHACRMWIWADMVCASASIANLAVISIDRRLKITRPFSYHDRMTQTRALFAIAGVWIYAILLASLSLVTWPGDRGIFVSQGGSCFNQNRLFYTVAALVGFLSPLAVLALNYCLVYVTALNQFHKIKKVTFFRKASMEHKNKKRRITKDFKATKTLAVVIGTFCTCWCPFFVIFTIMQYNETIIAQISRPWNEVVFTAFILVLPNLNAMCNPAIYTFFNSDFRRAFWKVLSMFVRSEDLNLYDRQSSLSNLLYTARRRSEIHGQGGHRVYYKSCNVDGQSPCQSLVAVHVSTSLTGRGKPLATAV